MDLMPIRRAAPKCDVSTDREVERTVRYLLNLAELRDWNFQWTRSKTKMGGCLYRSKVIELSKPLTDALKPECRQKSIINTILHEIAHALAPKGEHHGPTWKLIAEGLGCDAEIYYSEDVIDERAINYKWIIVCDGCGMEWHRHRLKRSFKRSLLKGWRRCTNCNNDEFTIEQLR